MHDTPKVIAQNTAPFFPDGVALSAPPGPNLLGCHLAQCLHWVRVPPKGKSCAIAHSCPAPHLAPDQCSLLVAYYVSALSRLACSDAAYDTTPCELLRNTNLLIEHAPGKFLALAQSACTGWPTAPARPGAQNGQLSVALGQRGPSRLEPCRLSLPL